MKYQNIAKHYNDCFHKHGDSHLGVDWPNFKDTLTRHKVMSEIFLNNDKATILDFGCGLGHYYEYLKGLYVKTKYYGLDINSDMIEHCKNKYPYMQDRFICTDIHSTLSTNKLPQVDYVIANGTFTEKQDLSHQEMSEFFYETLKVLWKSCDRGMAFNIMSKCVDWERDDLFHLSMDDLGLFLKNNLSSEFSFRFDYKLYEYTTYVYKR